MLLRRTNQRCADYFRLGCCFLPANGSAVYRRFPVLIVGLKSSGIVRRCRNLPILQKRQKQQHIAAGAPLWQPVADPISDGAVRANALDKIADDFTVLFVAALRCANVDPVPVAILH